MKGNWKNKKWTEEEEEALLEGISKHGVGKWKKILVDPEFADELADRTNIDLKDKWRNIEISEASNESSPNSSSDMNDESSDDEDGSEAKTLESPVVSDESSPNSSSDMNHESSDDEDGSDLSEIIDKSVTQALKSFSISPLVSNESSPNSSSVMNNESRFAIFGDSSDCYDAMIFEALSTINHENGADLREILGFIEERHEVPQKCRGLLIYSLANLVFQDKVKKVQNRYKISITKATKPKLTLQPKDYTKPPELPSSSVMLTTSKETQEIDAAANKIAQGIFDKSAKKKRVLYEEGHFRKLVSECLEILVSEGKLEKELDCFTISELVNKVLEVAPEVVAKIVAEAENEWSIAKEAAEEAERMEKLVEESRTMLQLSLEIQKQCNLKSPHGTSIHHHQHHHHHHCFCFVSCRCSWQRVFSTVKSYTTG